MQHDALQRIYNFKQLQDENLPIAWGRYCDLIKARPGHEAPKNELLDIFYAGLTDEPLTVRYWDLNRCPGSDLCPGSYNTRPQPSPSPSPPYLVVDLMPGGPPVLFGRVVVASRPQATAMALGVHSGVILI